MYRYLHDNKISFFCLGEFIKGQTDIRGKEVYNTFKYRQKTTFFMLRHPQKLTCLIGSL
jgi:hypothetical protein